MIKEARCASIGALVAGALSTLLPSPQAFAAAPPAPSFTHSELRVEYRDESGVPRTPPSNVLSGTFHLVGPLRSLTSQTQSVKLPITVSIRDCTPTRCAEIATTTVALDVTIPPHRSAVVDLPLALEGAPRIFGHVTSHIHTGDPVVTIDTN